jgi:hypothetical protein
MYGDTTVVRALAGRLREQAGEIRAEAASLEAHAEAVEWTGLAADAMRRLARDHAGDLRVCSALHADAADALDRHAREVDRVEQLIASIEHRALAALDGARHAVAGLTDVLPHAVPDPLEHWAHHFVPPAHGSKEWLDVHVPSVW